MTRQITVILNAKVLFGDDEIFNFIRSQRGKFMVVATDHIIIEYEREAQSPILVQTRLIELGRYLIKRRASGSSLSREQIQGLGKRHARFVLDACSTQCDYFLTRREEWLKLNSVVSTLKYPLKIVKPEQFLREVEQ